MQTITSQDVTEAYNRKAAETMTKFLHNGEAPADAQRHTVAVAARGLARLDSAGVITLTEDETITILRAVAEIAGVYGDIASL